MYQWAWFNHCVFQIKSLWYAEHFTTILSTIHLSTLITRVFSQGYLNEDLSVFVQFPPVTDLPSILSSPPPAKSPSISYFHSPAIISSNSNSQTESSTVSPITHTHGFIVMMTSSNGNIFRVTGPLCREFTGHRWILLTKASDAELWCFLWSASE